MLSYKDSGVDIDEGNALVDGLKPLVQSTFDANVMQIIAFTFQVMFGLVMLIAPTSIFLLAGLSYLEISYKEWVKYIYKYVLIVFGIFIWIAIMINVIIPFISNLI